MAKIKVVNVKGEEVKDLTLTDSVWKSEINTSVMKDAIVLAQASQRQGTASTKTRTEVSGGGRKPYKQKGTGHARQGSNRAPQFPGGGVALGPKPRKYDKKQNRKERRLALVSALSDKLANKGIVVIDSFNNENTKTKEFNKMLSDLKINGKALVVCADENENLYLAARNNKKVAVMTPSEVNVLDLVATDYLLIDEASVKMIEEVLK